MRRRLRDSWGEGEGCRVTVEDVIDWERGCDTGRDRQFCEYPPGISVDAIISVPLCPYTSCTGDEGPYDGCLEGTFCVWTTEDQSQCLPTCDPTAPVCTENEVCQPLPKRMADGVLESVDVCAP